MDVFRGMKEPIDSYLTVLSLLIKQRGMTILVASDALGD